MILTKIRTFCAALTAIMLAAGCGGGLKHEQDTDAADVVDTIDDTAEDLADDPVPDGVEDPADDPVEDPVVDADDDAPPCDGEPCGFLPNCGCPDGHKCTLAGTPVERRCVAEGTATRAEPCENDLDCEADTLCARMFSPAGADEPICFALCRSDSDCPGDAAICMFVFSPETEVGYCTTGCDLLTGEPCPDGSKCKWLRTTAGVNYTDCTADVGTGLMGSSCTGEEHCAPGHFCAGGENCMEYCRISPAPDTCTFGCRQFTIDSAPVDLVFDGVSYGYCWP
jgi:hypothetical protein